MLLHQQRPILAALGAEVTVFDNCKKRLEKDEFVAQRDGLKIKTIQGDMKDLSVFNDETFASLTKEEFERVTVNEGVCFGHSLNDLIQGQIDVGFLITRFYEDIGGSPLDKYIPTFFTTKAIKL